jgi:hypothetical protein
MSYPQYHQHFSQHKHYITFTVPNRQVINKIAQDALDSNRLYVTTLARSLSKNIKELAIIFREYELATSPIEEEHELRVRIVLPYLPNHHKLRKEQIPEERQLSSGSEIDTEGFERLSVHNRATMYQHLSPLTTIWEDESEE